MPSRHPKGAIFLSISRDSRQEKKFKAFARAQYGIKAKFDRIDWEEDFFLPALEEIKSGRKVFELDPGDAFSMVTENDAGDSQSLV